MIEVIKKEQFKKMVELYETYKPEDFIRLDRTILKELEKALINQSYIAYHDEGFVILYVYDNNIALNPWFFNGYPIGHSPHELMEEARTFFYASDFKRLEMIGDKDHLAGKHINIPFAYDYADLSKIIYQESAVEGEFVPCKDVDEEQLKAIYHRAFQSSDALFYTFQSEEEKEEFWRCLHYDKAKDDPASLCILHEGKIIGFVLTYVEGHKNRHISCMCIEPEYFGRGYGTLLLKQVFHVASLNEDESISLGTEVSMKAYDLYINNGFTVTNTKSYFIEVK